MIRLRDNDMGNARPKAKDKAKPSTLSVKLNMDVIELARVVAAIDNRPIGEMVSELVRPILTRMRRERMTRILQSDQAKGEEGLK